MWLLWIVPLWIIAFGVLGISASLRRLAEHHEKFPAPEPEPANPSAPL